MVIRENEMKYSIGLNGFVHNKTAKLVGMALKGIAVTALSVPFIFTAGAAEDGDKEDKEESGFMEQIIITGSSSRGMTALETSYGVAILDSEDIFKSSPVGLTEVVDAIPGLQGEYANGEVNSNLNVRGTQGGFMSFISLQEDGLPVQYSPFFAEYELRHDLSFGRVESVLGGPSGVFTAQGAGATINYISRRPTGEAEGEIAVSVTDYGQVRTDFFYGGDIGDDGWSGAIGGFYRQGDTVRDTGYTASSGGQIRASLTKDFDDGSLTFAYKKIDDASPYFNPLPTDTTSGSPSAIAGFDARYDGLSGPDVRILNSKRPDGDIVTRDLADGNISKTEQFTISFEHNFDSGFSISEKLRFSQADTVAHDLRGGSDAGLMEAEDFVASQLSVLQDAFSDVESVRLVQVNDGTVYNDPSALNGNGLVSKHDLLEYNRSTQNFINDLRVNWESENQNVFLTFGLQSWRVNTESSQLADTFLIDISPTANRLDVEGLDAAGNVVAHLTDAGVFSYGSTDNYGGLETVSDNLYFNAEVQVTDDLRIDFGARHEEATATAFGEDVSFGVPIVSGADNNILADDSRGVTRNGQVHTGTIDYKTQSITIGGNYTITEDLAIYARYASAEDMGFNNEFTFFNIPGFSGQTGINLGLSDKPTELTFAELGARYLGETVSGYITYFDTLHKNAGSISADENGLPVVHNSDTVANGFEFWLDFDLVDNLDLSVSGVIMDAERQSSGPSLPVNRVPETQLRFSSTYNFSNASVFANIQYNGDRNQDDGSAATAVTLPAYTLIDVGVNVDVTDELTIGLKAKNLTDKFAYTSANFRGIVPSSSVRFNSVIPGRNFAVTANYRF